MMSYTKPPLPKRRMNPRATITLGMTNGTVRMALISRLPGKSYLANMYAPGRPIRSVKPVEARAWAIVKPMTLLWYGFERTEARNFSVGPLSHSPVWSMLSRGT